ncbi:hypothetical protein C8R43DRAFT_1202249 [Mycena crocata]|nr:hypothetical protein C8R43DRAFT_1202249 [Mycena crocata]
MRLARCGVVRQEKTPRFEYTKAQETWCRMADYLKVDPRPHSNCAVGDEKAGLNSKVAMERRERAQGTERAGGGTVRWPCGRSGQGACCGSATTGDPNTTTQSEPTLSYRGPVQLVQQAREQRPCTQAERYLEAVRSEISGWADTQGCLGFFRRIPLADTAEFTPVVKTEEVTEGSPTSFTRIGRLKNAIQDTKGTDDMRGGGEESDVVSNAVTKDIARYPKTSFSLGMILPPQKYQYQCKRMRYRKLRSKRRENDNWARRGAARPAPETWARTARRQSKGDGSSWGIRPALPYQRYECCGTAASAGVPFTPEAVLRDLGTWPGFCDVDRRTLMDMITTTFREMESSRFEDFGMAPPVGSGEGIFYLDIPYHPNYKLRFYQGSRSVSRIYFMDVCSASSREAVPVPPSFRFVQLPGPGILTKCGTMATMESMRDWRWVKKWTVGSPRSSLGMKEPYEDPGIYGKRTNPGADGFGPKMALRFDPDADDFRRNAQKPRSYVRTSPAIFISQFMQLDHGFRERDDADNLGLEEEEMYQLDSVCIELESAVACNSFTSTPYTSTGRFFNINADGKSQLRGYVQHADGEASLRATFRNAHGTQEKVVDRILCSAYGSGGKAQVHGQTEVL